MKGVVVVVGKDEDKVKTRMVLPLTVKVAVPPPPFAVVLEKVPTLDPMTWRDPKSSSVTLIECPAGTDRLCGV